MAKFAGIVLAAGASTRMGAMKQLLDYQGKTLLARAIETARAAGLTPVVVIVGCDRNGAIEAEARRSGATVVRNEAWEKGMGTSIRAGVEAVAELDAVEGLILLTCDQPLVTAEHLRRMVALLTAESMVAAAYGGTVGVPAAFGKRFFPELATLADDRGAKAILLKHPDCLKTVALPEAAMDIDERSTYAALVSDSLHTKGPS